MPRAALSEVDVEEFRRSICDVATRLFARDGYAGVTLRALAAELGCSPMTPYRYFENKEAIFDAVRDAAFDRFANAQTKAAREATESLDKLRRLGAAYARFAQREPNAYRIMFELDPPEANERPAHLGSEHRAWRVMRDVVGEAVADGGLEGDPTTLAHLFWSGMHGLVSLHLAGKLELGRSLESLIEPFFDHQLRPATTGRGPLTPIRLEPTS
jgi:AcrR family transcriptional regulator